MKYAWKPDICSHFKVFGHDIKDYNKKPKTNEEIEALNCLNAQTVLNKDKNSRNDGFTVVVYKKRGGNKQNGNNPIVQGNNGKKQGGNVVYRRKEGNKNNRVKQQM